MAGNRMKFGIGITLILLSVVWLGFTGFQESNSYYVTLEELGDLGDRAFSSRLRIAGDVEEGSIIKSGSKVSFALKQENLRLEVEYVGKDPLPDTFKDGAQAVVEGIYERTGDFKADFIQAKCASKYEAEY